MTWDEVAALYDERMGGGRARTLPMDEVLQWLKTQPDVQYDEDQDEFYLIESGLPKFFKEWLQSLSKEQAKEFWEWYDGTPDHGHEGMYDQIGDALAEVHPDLWESPSVLNDIDA